MLVDFKESFINITKNVLTLYDQLPTRDTPFPFGVYEVTIFPYHNFGHRINQIRVLVDLWHNTTNTREVSNLADNFIKVTNRVSIDKFYGKIESVQQIPTQEENLIRYQIIYDYKYIGGY